LTGAHNAAWREWFESAGIEPYPVRDAELAADPAGTAGLL
jgi:LPS sulfotransferase NodH